MPSLLWTSTQLTFALRFVIVCRYVCVDVRADSSRPRPTHEESAFVRYKIINDRKFVTLVVPKKGQNNRGVLAAGGGHHSKLHDALRTHHKEVIDMFENEPPEYDSSLGSTHPPCADRQDCCFTLCFSCIRSPRRPHNCSAEGV